MTVAELIAELQKMPQDAEVMAHSEIALGGLDHVVAVEVYDTRSWSGKVVVIR